MNIKEAWEQLHAQDADIKWEENKHPRAKNGQFSKVAGGGAVTQEQEDRERARQEEHRQDNAIANATPEELKQSRESLEKRIAKIETALKNSEKDSEDYKRHSENLERSKANLERLVRKSEGKNIEEKTISSIEKNYAKNLDYELSTSLAKFSVDRDDKGHKTYFGRIGKDNDIPVKIYYDHDSDMWRARVRNKGQALGESLEDNKQNEFASPTEALFYAYSNYAPERYTDKEIAVMKKYYGDRDSDSYYSNEKPERSTQTVTFNNSEYDDIVKTGKLNGKQLPDGYTRILKSLLNMPICQNQSDKETVFKIWKDGMTKIQNDKVANDSLPASLKSRLEGISVNMVSNGVKSE